MAAYSRLWILRASGTGGPFSRDSKKGGPVLLASYEGARAPSRTCGTSSHQNGRQNAARRCRPADILCRRPGSQSRISLREGLASSRTVIRSGIPLKRLTFQASRCRRSHIQVEMTTLQLCDGLVQNLNGGDSPVRHDSKQRHPGLDRCLRIAICRDSCGCGNRTNRLSSLHAGAS